MVSFDGPELWVDDDSGDWVVVEISEVFLFFLGQFFAAPLVQIVMETEANQGWVELTAIKQ